MDDLIGKTLAGRYRVEAFLGKGGMAEVYKVWDAHRSSYLAMKLLHEDLALDNVFLRRFKREAQTLARLQHPNIVRFYELEQEGRKVFMLIDYVEGESLKHKIFDAQGPLPFYQIMEVMRPLCQALQYAHNEGLVHADVKPGNIMIDKTGRVLLSDFGIARMTESATVTMVGAGTPAYMSPEQARGEMPTPQTDIYALGIVLYEMLTGERPFTGELATISGSTGEKIRWEQLNLNPLSPRQLNSQVSEELEAIVMKCLEKNPDIRYTGAMELLNALELVSGESKPARQTSRPPAKEKPPLATRTKPEPVAQTASRPTIRKSVLATLIVVAGVIGITVIFFALNRTHSTSSANVPPVVLPAQTARPIDTILSTALPSATAISSPIPPTTTPTTGPLTLTFQQNFERGNMDGFRLMGGDWSVVPENNTSKVLQAKELPDQPWPYIEFGPENFHNGVIQYRFNIKEIDATDSDAGMEYIFFRVSGNWTGDSYTFQVQIHNNLEELDYVSQNWNWIALQKQLMPISPNCWYTVKLEVNNWNFKVYLDNALYIDTNDSGFQGSTAGRLGFQGSPKSTVWFDDVQVWESAP